MESLFIDLHTWDFVLAPDSHVVQLLMKIGNNIIINNSQWAELRKVAYNSRIYKGVFHEDVTYQHPLFVNNSNNNHY